VLAVLGLAIGISYDTASRSLLNARQAQENSIATGIVQNQIEGLRSLGRLIQTSPANYIYISSQFCLTANSSVVTTFVANPPPECTLPFAPTTSTISIIHCGGVNSAGAGSSSQLCLTLNNDTFIVTASWPDVAGVGTDTVSQDYRVHP
jgi:type II secretory pathway pseudopilin PulG